jgi:hypothetical protein
MILLKTIIFIVTDILPIFVKRYREKNAAFLPTAKM